MTRTEFLMASVATVFGLLLVAQSQESARSMYAGQLVKIDSKNKMITINGPMGSLIPDQAEPARGSREGGSGRRGGGEGGSGRGGAGASAGGAGRSAGRGRGGSGARTAGGSAHPSENVDTKIVWSVETKFESVRDEKLSPADLRVGDFVVIDTTKNGKKIQAATIRRTSAASERP